MRTSAPSAARLRASSSMAKVLPTPGAAPKKTFSFPRRRGDSDCWTFASRASGSGRRWSAGVGTGSSRLGEFGGTPALYGELRAESLQGEVELEAVHARFAKV